MRTKLFATILVTIISLNNWANTVISYKSNDYQFYKQTYSGANGSFAGYIKYMDDGSYAVLQTSHSARILLFKVFKGKVEGMAYLFQAMGSKNFITDYTLSNNETYDMSNLQLDYKLSYENGELTGKQYRYHLNGNLAVEVTYEKGRKDGEEVQYYDNGNVYTRFDYKDNKLHDGPVEFHYSSGVVWITGTVANRVATGDWTYYHPNGEIMAKGERGSKISGYSGGVRIDKWKFYDQNGKLIESVKFKNELNPAFGHNRILEKFDVEKTETKSLIEKTKKTELDWNNWITHWPDDYFQLSSKG